MYGIRSHIPSPAIYSMVVEPRRAGPIIGSFGGMDICEEVLDQFGRRFVYAGVVGRARHGHYDLASLKTGEFIVEPGLIYAVQIEKSKHGGKTPAAALPPSALPPFSAAESAVQRGEDRRIVGQLATALMLFLTGALAVQLVLQALHAG